MIRRRATHGFSWLSERYRSFLLVPRLLIAWLESGEKGRSDGIHGNVQRVMRQGNGGRNPFAPIPPPVRAVPIPRLLEECVGGCRRSKPYYGQAVDGQTLHVMTKTEVLLIYLI
jgi:hypothetical protein